MTKLQLVVTISWQWSGYEIEQLRLSLGSCMRLFQHNSIATALFATQRRRIQKNSRKRGGGEGGRRRRENREYIGSGEVSSSSICIVTERFVAFSWHEKFKLCQFSLTFLDLKGREGFSPQFCCSLSAQCWSEDTFNKTKI